MRFTTSKKVIIIYCLSVFSLVMIIIFSLTSPEYRELPKSSESGFLFLHLFNKQSILLSASIFSIVIALVAMGFIISDFHERRKRLVELKNLNNNKDKFFSMISHDLKGPAYQLIGLSELLLEKNVDCLNKETLEIVKMINTASRKHYNLLMNLLDWSKLQMGRLQPEAQPCSLRNLVEETFLYMESKAREKNIELVNKTSREAVVYSDCNIISTVLRNIVNNAIKFTKQGGRVTICSNASKDQIEISVQDTGIGIKEDILKKLFTAGEQKSSPGTAGEEGSGIGLLLCKEFVEKCGGRIRAESIPGKGSTFSFTIPVWKKHQQLQEAD